MKPRRLALRLALVAAGLLLLLAFSPVGSALLERAPDALLLRATQWAPRDPRPHLILGERRLARGEVRPALQSFERAASLGSQDFRLAIALADAMRAAGLHEKAAAQARELLKIEPEAGRLHRILGQSLLARGEMTEGLAALEEATRRAPEDADGWIALAEARLGIDGFQPRTAQVWEDGCARNRHDPILRYGLAESEANLGRYEDAETTLMSLPKDPVPQNPKAKELYARAWTARGIVLRRWRPDPERLAQSRQALERALALAPEQPDAHYELGVLHAEAGEWEAARLSLQSAIRLRPYAHPFWYHLARVQRRLGQEAEAARSQKRFDTLVGTFDVVNRESRALDADPHDVARRLRLARLLIERWDWEAAGLHLSLVPRDHPRHPEAARLMARVRARR